MPDRLRLFGNFLVILLPTEPALAEWSASTGARLSYTTNIFQFFSASRLSIDQDPSQPLVVRDILEKPNDFIWQPHVLVGRSWSSTLGASALSFKTEGSIYTNNPSFNNAYYRLDFKQELEPKKTSLELIYRYTPHLVLGSGRVSSQANTFDEQRTTSHIWRAQLERHVDDRWTVVLIGRYGRRFYNEPFTE